MVTALRHVQSFSRRFTREQFLEDVQIRWSFERAFEIVGEAAKHAPAAVRQRHPEVDWRGLAGFRDVLVHGYYRVEPRIVWNLATRDGAVALEQLERVLASESEQEADGS